MSLGSDLIKLQQTDLDLDRERKTLKNLPVIAELAKKRASYARLKSEATRLLAARKDAQIAVDDLAEAERSCREAAAAAKARPLDATDYRAVHDLEVELSLLAKKIDKIEYDRPSALEALEAACEREQKLSGYIKRFEEGIVADTKAARAQAAELQASIDELTRRREHLLSRLPEDVRATYERGIERFKGLVVERIEGNVPTICRTALQPASMDALRHAGDIAECPYCHRIIVVNDQE